MPSGDTRLLPTLPARHRSGGDRAAHRISSPTAAPRRMRLALIAALAAFALAAPGSARANGLACTYNALVAALASGTPDPVLFSGACTISFSGHGPITIAANHVVTIDGGGQVVFDGGGTTQLFLVNPAASLTLIGLTLRNGHAANTGAASNLAHAFGGAINDRGTLIVRDCTFSGNVAVGAAGAAAQGGGGGGGAGLGGAIFALPLSYNDPGPVVTISGSTFKANSATGGAGGASTAGGGGGGGGGGMGGAIFAGTQYYNWKLPQVTVVNSTFIGNTAQGGSGGGYSGGTAGNASGGAGGGKAGQYGFGTGGTGGIYTTINGSSVTYGLAGSFGAGGGGLGGSGGLGGGGGGAGNGGGGSDGGGGHGGAGDPPSANIPGLHGGGGGGGGLGAAIYSDGNLTLESSTLAGNTATRGSGSGGGNAGSGQGGGLFNCTYPASCPVAGTAIVENTIIARNAGNQPDVSQTAFTSYTGHNLIGVSYPSIGFSAGEGDLFGSAATPLDPGFSPAAPTLGSHGGPTQTIALAANSPAVSGAGGTCLDRIPQPFQVLTTDQRGWPRLTGVIRCDIGAYQLLQTPTTAMAVSAPTGGSPYAAGSSITFIATVLPAPADSPALFTTGTITFTDTAHHQVLCAGVPLTASSTATCQFTPGGADSYVVEASYDGNDPSGNTAFRSTQLSFLVVGEGGGGGGGGGSATPEAPSWLLTLGGVGVLLLARRGWERARRTTGV